MRYYEIFERSVEPSIFGMVKQAYARLSSEARNAIESWETSNWTEGSLVQHIKANDKVAQEIESIFAPIRAHLPETITLYRGVVLQNHYTGWDKAILQSWTTDRRVAELFAGLRQGSNFETLLYPELSDAEIEHIVSAYERTGFAKANGRYYIRNKAYPQYYNIYSRDRQYITDGDNLEKDLRSDNETSRDFNRNKEMSAKVFEEEISRNRVVWITNQLNCKEFIVRR